MPRFYIHFIISKSGLILLCPLVIFSFIISKFWHVWNFSLSPSFVYVFQIFVFFFYSICCSTLPLFLFFFAFDLKIFVFLSLFLLCFSNLGIFSIWSVSNLPLVICISFLIFFFFFSHLNLLSDLPLFLIYLLIFLSLSGFVY